MLEMNQSTAERWVTISALIVAGVYGYRRVTEDSTAGAPPKGSKTSAKAIAGLAPTVPPLGTFATAWGATFLVVSIMASANPGFGGGFAVLIAVTDVMTNLQSILADQSKAQAGTLTALADQSAQNAGKGIAQGAASATNAVGSAGTGVAQGASKGAKASNRQAVNTVGNIVGNAAAPGTAAWDKWFNQQFDNEWNWLWAHPGQAGTAPPASNPGKVAAYNKYWGKH